MSYRPNSYSSIRRVKNYSYSPLESIGKGFSSIVYRGHNDENSKSIISMETCFHFILSFIILEESVAIKAIDMNGVRDSAAREMLDCEIEALTTLNHQNIMKCYDVVKQSSHCFIITQLCNGGDLGEMLKKKGKFSQQDALPILKGIIKGYVQMGSKGFLHRDLKLANVLMSNGQAKIADFGFAKKIKTQSIKERYNVGSPLYMSPQALKHNIYSMKNDIWSIGIMAFEMLHGDTPWQCRTEKQLIEKMTKVPVKFKQSLKISSDLKDFIRKCLQISESKRMSLQGLKEWLEQLEENSDKQKQNVLNYQPRLMQKQTTFDKLENRPLSELTNRMNGNKGNKSVNKIKVPLHEANAQQNLSKSKIGFNNNLIIKEIIVFRLFFKTLQKLKSTTDFVSCTNVCNILGNETIRRVTLLKKLICSEQISSNQHFNIKNVQAYLNPIFNPQIKKYKNVINQYFTKYTSQIKMQILDSKLTPAQTIATFLKTVPEQIFEKQKLLSHWLVCLTSVSTSLSKSELQCILQPRNQINSNSLRMKVLQMCA